MKPLDVEQLTRIDMSWRNSKPFDLHEILSTSRTQARVETLAELLSADSEWRWRKAGFGKVDLALAGCDWQDSRPRSVETYLKEVPELSESLEAVRMLIESEFQARSLWGNPPMIAEFTRRFPSVEGLDQLLRESLDELSRLYVARLEPDNQGAILSENERKHSHPVCTPLSIGRQAMNEPRDRFLMPNRRRLIVVDNYQHGVSRQHAMITRQSLDKCWVANVSPFGEMKVNGQAFPAKSRMMTLIPLTVEVGGVRLKFFLA